MGGIFGFFDYSKPGPGVDENAPPKPRIIVFFELLGRKFWNFVKLNFMFSIFNLPAVIAAMYIISLLIQRLLFDDLLNDLIVKFSLSAVILCLPIITVGPAQAGFTYILRNYARQEHAFLWWDFKENAIKNFKQSMAVCLIDLLVAFVVAIDLQLYAAINSNSLVLLISKWFLTLAILVYMMMHLYIYPMMVTFKLGLKQLYKNALIFAVIKFLPNLVILLLCSVIVLATFYFSPIIGFILFPLFTMSLIGFIINYYVQPYLKKYIMDKAEAVSEGSDEINAGDEAK